jgi:hypothetical protein
VRLLVGHWLGLSAYRSLEEISAGESLLIFSPAFMAALAAFILSPAQKEGSSLDLSAHYFKVSPWVYSLMAAFTFLAGFSDLLIPGREPLPLWFYVLWAAVLMIPAFNKDRRVHGVVIGASLVIPVIFGAATQINP